MISLNEAEYQRIRLDIQGYIEISSIYLRNYLWPIFMNELSYK